MVFIIDALDECSTSNASYTSRKKLLETLRLWSKFLKIFKLFVTSRPEKDIEEYLKDISYPIVLYTGEYVEPETSQDIQKFLYTHLQNVTTNDIKEFTRQAARLFIFAETVIQFVNGGPLEERVKMILSGKLEIGNIDKLYFTTLEKNFDKSTNLEQFASVIGCLVFAKIPLQSKVIVELLQHIASENTVQFYFNKLKPMIIKMNGRLQLSHQSISDFFIDSTRFGRYNIDQNK